MSKKHTAEVFEVVSPDGYQLQGLWFGPTRPQRVYLLVHGLASSVFSQHELLTPLVDKTTAAVFFNNRGHDIVSGIKRVDKRTRSGYSRYVCGAAFEVFEECIDDITGLVQFCVDRGANEVVLVGHSTGCQKSVYYATSRVVHDAVSALCLLSPLSDYAGVGTIADRATYIRAHRAARRMIAADEGDRLLPTSVWPSLLTADRFLSLYDADSSEEIFTYAQSNVVPRRLRRLRLPTLVVIGEEDIYLDRSAVELGDWFFDHLRCEAKKIYIAPGGSHTLSESRGRVRGVLRRFIE